MTTGSSKETELLNRFKEQRIIDKELRDEELNPVKQSNIIHDILNKVESEKHPKSSYVKGHNQEVYHKHYSR